MVFGRVQAALWRKGGEGRGRGETCGGVLLAALAAAVASCARFPLSSPFLSSLSFAWSWLALGSLALRLYYLLVRGAARVIHPSVLRAHDAPASGSSGGPHHTTPPGFFLCGWVRCVTLLCYRSGIFPPGRRDLFTPNSPHRTAGV